jgi:flagellar secretion chaperone FliS
MGPALTTYNKVYVETTISKTRILLDLYEGAIRFVGFAEKVLEERDIARKGEYISRAIAIIGELDNALDRKAGGEIVSNLSSLYAYMLQRLTEANRTSNSLILKEVRILLEDLLDTWKQAAQQSPDTDVPTQPSKNRMAFCAGKQYGGLHVAS